MAKQTINDGEDGLVVRGKINDNFTELYDKHDADLTEDQQLIEWAGGKDVEMLSRTLNGDGLTTSATLKWPDGSGGDFTATDYNATHELYDGWTKSHTASGKTVTQAAVTRNADGIVTNKPALTVA